MRFRWHKLISTTRRKLITCACIIGAAAVFVLTWSMAMHARPGSDSGVTLGQISGPNSAGAYTVAVKIDNTTSTSHNYFVEVRLRDASATYGTAPVTVYDLRPAQSFDGFATFTSGRRDAHATIVAVAKS